MYGAVTGLLMNTLVVWPPLALGRAIDAALAIEKSGATSQAIHLFGVRILWFIFATAVYSLFRIGKRYGFRVMSSRLGASLRADMLSSFLDWPVPRIRAEKIGDLMSRTVGDVQVVADTTQTTVTEVFDTGVMMASNFVALFTVSASITLIGAIPVPLTLIAASLGGRAIFRRSARARASASSVTSSLHQNLAGLRVLRMFGREAAERTRLESLCRQQLADNLALTRLQGGLMPVYSGIATLGVLYVIGRGGHQVFDGVWTVGRFTSYLAMFLAMAQRTLVAARVLNSVNAGKAAWSRLEPYLPAAPFVWRASYQPAPTTPRIVASSLSMTYGGAAVLTDLSFIIEPGQFVGITGPVGCGKTSLGLVLAGLYQYEGNLEYGGRELKGLHREDSLSMVAYLGQEGFLFSDTIATNIELGPADTGAPDLARCMELAELSGDMPLFSEGERTQVGESGLRVSGGQRQRIALARAIRLGRPILVLDDPFSAVDIATERQLIKHLREELAGTTVILLSHRLTAFSHCDKVLVLEQGHITDEGTHDELMLKGGIYSRILRAQEWLFEEGGEASGA